MLDKLAKLASWPRAPVAGERVTTRGRRPSSPVCMAYSKPASYPKDFESEHLGTFPAETVLLVEHVRVVQIPRDARSGPGLNFESGIAIRCDTDAHMNLAGCKHSKCWVNITKGRRRFAHFRCK